MEKNNGNDTVGDTVRRRGYGNIQQYFFCFRFYINNYLFYININIFTGYNPSSCY